MGVAQTVKAIEKALAAQGSKSDKARALYRLGLERTEVVELVGMNYSQAHSVWKRMVDDGELSARVRIKGSVPKLREKPERAGTRSQPSERRLLFLTPTQTRYITQDGHVIVRIDRDSGAECQECGQRVQFSLTWLGFVHSRSHTEPTEVEDRYEQ